MVFTAASRTKIREHDQSWLAKFIIRGILIILAFVALGTIAWAVARVFSVNSGDGRYYDSGTIVVAVSLGPISLAIIWSVVWMLVVVFRSKPPHPGFAVGFDLVLFLFLVVISILSFIITFYRSGYNDFYYTRRAKRSPAPAPQYYGNYDGYGSYGGGINDHNTAYYQDLAHRVYIVTIVGCSFMFIMCILEFILFVWACVDTHRYNRKKRDDELQALANSMMAPMLAQQQAQGYQMQQGQQGYMMQQAPIQQQTQSQPFYAYQPVQQSLYNPPTAQAQHGQTRQATLSPGPRGDAIQPVEDNHGISNPSDPSSVAGPSSPTSNRTQPEHRQPSPMDHGASGGVNGNGAGNTWRSSYTAGPVESSYYPAPGDYQAH